MAIEVKYRVKEVAADFGVTPKEISEIVGKYYEKPRSNTQVLTADELNAVFEHITRHNQIADIAQVFNVKPKEQPAPKAEQPAQKQEAPKQPAQQANRPQQQANRPQQQGRPVQQNQNQNRPQQQNRPAQSQQPQQPVKPAEPERKRERRVVDTSAVHIHTNIFFVVSTI